MAVGGVEYLVVAYSFFDRMVKYFLYSTYRFLLSPSFRMLLNRRIQSGRCRKETIK